MTADIGICFLDKYIDETWEVCDRSPDNNCYLRVDYKLDVTETDVVRPGWTIDQYRRQLSDILESWYYENEDYFFAELCFWVLAFHRIGTGLWKLLVGKGGDGKGKNWLMERGLLGKKNTATMDIGCLLDRKGVPQVGTPLLEQMRFPHSREQ